MSDILPQSLVERLYAYYENVMYRNGLVSLRDVITVTYITDAHERIKTVYSCTPPNGLKPQ